MFCAEHRCRKCSMPHISGWQQEVLYRLIYGCILVKLLANRCIFSIGFLQPNRWQIHEEVARRNYAIRS